MQAALENLKDFMTEMQGKEVRPKDMQDQRWEPYECETPYPYV